MANKDHVVKATVVDGQRMDAWTSELAERLAKDETFETIVESTSDAAEVARIGAVPMHDLLTSLFSNEELESFPIPGTADTEGHNNPDKYGVVDPTNLKANGEKKIVRRSFWNDLFDKTPVGQRAIQNLSAYKLAASNPAEAKPEYVDMSNDRRDSMIKKWSNRQTYGRKLLKDAFNLWAQLQAVNTLLGEHVLARIVREEDGTIVSSARCIGVIDRKDPTKGAAMSVANFISLDVEKAVVNGKADGKYYLALMQTIKKGTNGKTDAANAKAVKIIGTTTEAEGYIAELSAWFNTDDRDAKARRGNQLRKAMLEDGNDELVLSFGRLFRVMEDIFTSDNVDVRYAELVEAELKARKAA